MSTSVIELHEQRRFLMVAFHPYGSDVCQLLGMPMPSLDVDEVERQVATVPWSELMGYGSNDEHFSAVTPEQVLAYARLYEVGAASLIGSQHPSYNRSLGEDLVSFFIALVSLGGNQ